MSETRGARLLLVDDDSAFLRSLSILLEDEGGYQVACASSGPAALQLLEERPDTALVISDLSMPGIDGIELLQRVQEVRPECLFMLMTAHGAVDTAVRAMQLGAFQYLCKPIDPDEVLVQVGRALELARTRSALRQLEKRFGEPGHHDRLVGSSLSMANLERSIGGLARVDSTVLLRGETGTGKELVARLIHASSARAEAPFVVVNCTAIPRELLESELFGHEKGAFTGATTAHRGRIEEAEGGTLLLDEVGDMPVELQPKLLRFLQDRTTRRIGGSRDRVADLRIMAATHRELEQAIADGEFREDLFYRLNTVPLQIPPLREHPEDLSELCEHLMVRIALRLGMPAVAVSAATVARLGEHDFPGNVRELENLLERAVVLGHATGNLGSMLEPEHLQWGAERRPRSADSFPEPPLEGGFDALQAAYEQAEEQLVRRALSAWPALSNREIAERLGTNRRVLELRMKAYGLSKRGGS